MAGAVLRGARERQGLGLREAARLSGVDAAYLCKIEKGKQGCGMTTLAALAPVLGLGPGDIRALLDEAREGRRESGRDGPVQAEEVPA